jgi:hypothetical protein
MNAKNTNKKANVVALGEEREWVVENGEWVGSGCHTPKSD